MIEILFPDGVPDNLKAYGLVMPEAVRSSLILLQNEHGSARHRLSPVALTDGRWALNADILTEVYPSGLFGDANLINEDKVRLVQVLPWADVEALLPVSDLYGLL